MNSISFLHTLKSIALKHHERDAFFINNINYTYKQFYEKVNTIANHILSISGDQLKIVVAVNNDLETYASIIAIWQTGNTYIPLNFKEENSKLTASLKLLDTDLLLSSKPIKNTLFKKHKTLFTSKIKESKSTRDLININENNIAYILFTSGSTGTPKGVPISYKNLDAFVDSFLKMKVSFTSTDVFLQMSDLTFDMSIISFLIPLCIGAKVVTIKDETAKYLATYQALNEDNISVLITAPSTLQLLEPFYAEINLKQLKYTFVGAESFYASTAEAWQQCAPNSEIINLYGPSEGGILSTAFNWTKSNKADNHVVAIGKPVKNIDLIVVDNTQELASKGTKGELWIGGSQVFDSYFSASNNKEKFSEFELNDSVKKYYKTGDIAFEDKDGDLFYCGRIDDQVKIQGKRVELAEIENLANRIASNYKPKAICYQDRFKSNKIALFIDNEVDIIELNELLKSHLPSYMIPSKIIHLNALPLNKNQKLDTSKLMNLIYI